MDSSQPPPVNNGGVRPAQQGDGKAHQDAYNQVTAALRGDANAMRDMSRATGLSFDAPLQLKRHHKVKPQGLPVTTRFINFVRRNAGFFALGCFIYVEFIGFPVTVASSKEERRLVAIRTRFFNKVAAARVYDPPVPQDQVERRGAFSLIGKELPSTFAPAGAKPERLSYGRRLYNYCGSYFPNPFFGSVDDSPEGRNTLQYNWLLYYEQEFSHRKTTLLPVDAITADGRLAVHAAVKVCFRTEVMKNPVSTRRKFNIRTGEVESMVDNVAANEIEKWIKGASAGEMSLAPPRRITSTARSLGDMSEAQLRASVMESAAQRQRRYENERAVAAAAAAAATDGAAAESAPADAQLVSFDAAKLLDNEETLRRIWTANITPRLMGRAIVEDITWKLTVTELRQGPDPRTFDPTIADNWTI